MHCIRRIRYPLGCPNFAKKYFLRFFPLVYYFGAMDLQKRWAALNNNGLKLQFIEIQKARKTEVVNLDRSG